MAITSRYICKLPGQRSCYRLTPHLIIWSSSDRDVFRGIHIRFSPSECLKPCHRSIIANGPVARLDYATNRLAILISSDVITRHTTWLPLDRMILKSGVITERDFPSDDSHKMDSQFSIYLCFYRHTYIYKYTHTYKHTHTHTHKHIYTYIYACTHTRTHSHAHAHTHRVCMCLCVRVCVCVCVRDGKRTILGISCHDICWLAA